MDRVVNERPGAEARTDRLLSRRCGRATRRRRGARTHGRGNAKSFRPNLARTRKHSSPSLPQCGSEIVSRVGRVACYVDTNVGRRVSMALRHAVAATLKSKSISTRTYAPAPRKSSGGGTSTRAGRALAAPGNFAQVRGSVPEILRSGPCAGPRAGRAAARRGATRRARDSRRKNRDQFPRRARTYAAPTRCGRSATG